MSHEHNFTDVEILLGADRFLIEHLENGSRLQLAEDFLATGKHLSTIEDCCKYVRTGLERGHKVFIEVSHESSRVPPASST